MNRLKRIVGDWTTPEWKQDILMLAGLGLCALIAIIAKVFGVQ